ncbi:CpaF family protein [Actinomycetota bacterium]
MNPVNNSRETEKYIIKKVFEKISGKDFKKFSAADRQKVIEKIVSDIADMEKILLTAPELSRLSGKINEDGFGLGPISLLMSDPEITEIMINDHDEVYIEKKGKIEKIQMKFRDSTHIRNLADKILGPLGLRLDESHPMVDARLKDGSRINIVLSPVSLKDIVVTIRRFKEDIVDIEKLIKEGTVNRKIGSFLARCVQNKANILIGGGTGTGKTTLLNILSGFLPKSERIITIEETMELRFTHKNLVRMETRPPNMEGNGEICIRDLVRNSLRMRPDRIIVGEIRGVEAIDVLQAMNTGHNGSMTTIHANSPKDVITRLETMLLLSGNNLDPCTSQRIIATSVDLIIQLEKTVDGNRVLSRISEVLYQKGGPGKKIKLEIRDIAIFDGGIKNRWVFYDHMPAFLKERR